MRERFQPRRGRRCAREVAGAPSSRAAARRAAARSASALTEAQCAWPDPRSRGRVRLLEAVAQVEGLVRDRLLEEAAVHAVERLAVAVVGPLDRLAAAAIGMPVIFTPP